MTPARRPRFLPFILTGAVIGFIVGASFAVFGWFEDTTPSLASNYPPSAGIGYLGLLGALMFGLLAGVVAILVEQRSDRP